MGIRRKVKVWYLNWYLNLEDSTFHDLAMWAVLVVAIAIASSLFLVFTFILFNLL
jgi:hypothetical protein